MPTGKLKWFDVSKGFGFILPDEDGPDVYLSATAVEATRLPRLTPGMGLSYELAEVSGRIAAHNVVVSQYIADADPIEEFEREWGLRRH